MDFLSFVLMIFGSSQVVTASAFFYSLAHTTGHACEHEKIHAIAKKLAGWSLVGIAIYVVVLIYSFIRNMLS